MKNFDSFEELLIYSETSNKPLWRICEECEAENSQISTEAVRNNVKNILCSMREAITTGLNSREKSPSGLCGEDCAKLKDNYKNRGSLLPNVYQNVLLYSLATIEQNARMGKIAACPTAGSCGIVPSVIIASAESMKADEKTQINALITAGLIGKIVSKKLALAGAVNGCQGECGVASAMAAAALTQMNNGTISQIFNSAALALKNIMGLVCDPVAGLVEVPCVKRNAFLSMHAVTASELALAGITSVIPLDEVVDAMRQVGRLMAPSLKESSEGGLAVTKTAAAITEHLREKWDCK